MRVEITRTQSSATAGADTLVHDDPAAAIDDATAGGGRPAHRGAHTALAFALVALVGVVVPVLLARHYGALGVPRGDDWSYLRALFRWTEHGRLDFNHWVSMTLVGQLVLAAPISATRGRDIAAVQLLTATLGFVCLGAVFLMAKKMTGRLSVATGIALVLASGPLWGVLTVGFMTDVPAAAFAMVTLALGVRALSRPEPTLPPVLLAMAFGVAAFTVREYAAIPLAAVVLAAGIVFALRRDREALMRLAFACACAAALIVAFAAFWRTIPDSKALHPSLPTVHAIKTLAYKGAGMARLVGLMVLPAVVWAGPVRIVRRAFAAANEATVMLGAVTLVWLGGTALAAPRLAFAGNYVGPDGALAQSTAAGHRPDLIPMELFRVITLIATVSTLIVVLAVVPLLVRLASAWRTRDIEVADPATMLLGVALAIYIGAYAVAAATGLPLYDRYALPAVPIVAILLVGSASRHSNGDPSRVRRVGAGVVLGALVLAGFAYTADSASFDGARWAVARAAEHAGWRPRQIGGNFEWVNYYSQHPGTRARARGHFCVTVRVNPKPPKPGVHREVVAQGWYEPPFRPRVPIVAARTKRPCSAPVPAPATP